MHAIAKMYRIYPDGKEVPIVAMMSPAAMGEVLPGEKIVIRLWHGTCLEAEATIQTTQFGSAMVTLTEKKELRNNAPPEATCP